MKIKKETSKKVVKKTTKNATPKKKVASKVRTVSLTKRVTKEIKTATSKKRVIQAGKQKTRTIAAPKKSESLARRNRIIAYRAKRLLYMVLSVTLGALIASFVLGFIELIYLKSIFRMGAIPVTHSFLGMQLFVEPIFFVLIFGLGVALGVWLGFWGWRVVYIEKRHRMFQKK
ncbi:MAG: hypothetical protein ACD_8C00088G0001 [uncultured bacterium]|nr:MAG: hypothetical protein ACD_8C00088G0001 [uncultured bacterium]